MSKYGHVPVLAESLRRNDPEGYLPSDGLRDAVSAALSLGRPLLLTGEPGTGKTQLAYSLAHDLHATDSDRFLSSEPVVFHAKTTSTATDLFYVYDALRHFHDARFRDTPPSPERYISYEALGRAIILSSDPARRGPEPPMDLRQAPQQRFVVLVDEIDKAPRDFPNDILNEIEYMVFDVKELRRDDGSPVQYRGERAFAPVMILTSNSEKNLPAPFLRRCVFFHIEFPGKNELLNIVASRFNLGRDRMPPDIVEAVDHFVDDIRKKPLKRLPGTDELLSWLQLLQGSGLGVKDGDRIAFSYSVLAKSREDLELLVPRRSRA